jgi:predicted extracellular nuclease
MESLTVNSDGLPLADLEPYEGMLVVFPQTLTITELHNLERYGEVRLSQGGRLFQFTNRNIPDSIAYASHRDRNALRSVLMDDGRRANNATPIRYLESDANVTRVGDEVAALAGNLRYSRGSGGSGTETWRLMPTAEPTILSRNPRPVAPNVEGTIKVASFNVLNYFSTIDAGERACGPDSNDRCRGADSSDELARQLTKIVSALTAIDADIVGLIELENNAEQSLVNIVDALNAELGAGIYSYIDTGTIGDDAIKTGFLYKPASVSLAGSFALLTADVDPRFNDKRNRPALAQTFVDVGKGGRLTIIVNHLKSKGSDCDADSDPNVSDGQGNCNLTRSRAAEALVDWIAKDPTNSNDPDYLIIGDLNAYPMEDPLGAFKSAGLINLMEAARGPEAYTFVFDGQSGALDHAVATQELAAQVAESVEWHINADEAPLYDYNLENGRDPGIFDGFTPYRSSDHDPVIVGLDLVP